MCKLKKRREREKQTTLEHVAHTAASTHCFTKIFSHNHTTNWSLSHHSLSKSVVFLKNKTHAFLFIWPDNLPLLLLRNSRPTILFTVAMICRTPVPAEHRVSPVWCLLCLALKTITGVLFWAQSLWLCLPAKKHFECKWDLCKQRINQ